MIKLKNKLKDQTSPYLLQHAENPVHWYPWCQEAFDRAKTEEKPIFLSIGYSTCHWCHVMAHESFEDLEVAEKLNQDFISIKVDKEERPDIDSIYMAVCVALTGSGGWPTSVFLTPEQKPFFAGTYFPKHSAYGRTGFLELLDIISKKWKQDKESLVHSAEEITRQIEKNQTYSSSKWENRQTREGQAARDYKQLAEQAVRLFSQSFDPVYGGFGDAPKFPTPHNLLFLMEYGQETTIRMAEKTLIQMYRGGIFDHIGYGFSRYSTDEYFLVPHFEKMLYDNALLLMSYTKAFEITGKHIYREIAEKTAEYICREMTSPEGGFYSAQDADSEGVEGKYYVFDYEELIKLLGEQQGVQFNAQYHITKEGNFEGRNIPNLLGDFLEEKGDSTFLDSSWKDRDSLKDCISRVYQYRKKRYPLHLDDKILVSWNSLMIAAFAMMYQTFGKEIYLQQAVKACTFIEERAEKQSENGTKDVLFVSWRDGKCQGKGFLDDYAFYIFALITLYDATLDRKYLERAWVLCKKTISDFKDQKQGGFFLYGKENEALIMVPKETYDGAIPSGNSVMAYNLVRLSQLLEDTELEKEEKEQLEFLAAHAESYPAGQSFFLLAVLRYLNPPEHIVCVLKDRKDLEKLAERRKKGADILVLEEPAGAYQYYNDKTTLYACKDFCCQPPVNI